MSLLVDSHAHLSGSEFDIDRHAVIQRAFQEGIGAILCPTELSEPRELQNTLDTLQAFPNIIASGGVHPHNAERFNPDCVQKIKNLADSEKIRAVGEIGVDLFYNFSPIETQIDVFRAQIKIAQDIGIPAIIHSRNAKDLVLKIVQEEAFTQGGILHCFTEDWEFAEAMIGYNFLISFSGILTFPRAQPLRDVAIQTPLHKILVETDSPYLVPIPYRGKIQRNEPVYVKETARLLAELKDVSFKKLAENTTNNFESLFQIEIIKTRC